jgi:hypothetical protein
MTEAFVRLVTGDPDLEPVTFSRFVLPFAYRPTKGPSDGAKGCYQPTPDPWSSGRNDGLGLERREYLTPETATTLFRRARWFHLEGAALGPFVATFAGGQSLQVQLKPPRLVLFEATDVRPDARGEGRAADKDPAELLRTGFLILDLFFPKDAGLDLSHLLEVNELFRYWREPFPGHYECKRGPRCFQREALYQGEKAAWPKSLEAPVRWEKDRTVQLFPKGWETKARAWIERSTPHGGQPSACDLLDLGWVAFTDPRAYVWSCVVAEGGGNALRTAAQKAKARPEELGHWVALLNVDHPAHLTPTAFETTWAEERTYTRWADDGSFYGFASHSGVALVPPFHEPPIWRQFMTMHFDQTLLLLYLRVTTFRFSQRLSEISGQAVKAARSESGAFLEKFRALRWAFALFTNLYQFPLLSSQQQGIEMYEKARKHMDVDALFDEVQREIQTTEEYLDGVVQGEQTDAQVVLSVVATVGLALALALSWVQVRPSGEARTAVPFDSGDWWMTVWMLVPWVVFTVVLLGFVWLAPWFNRVFGWLSGRRRKR